MPVTTLAQSHADVFSASALRQIAKYAHSVASKEGINYGMTSDEINKFATLEAAINDILELQSVQA
jgi:hypothetical protein